MEEPSVSRAQLRRSDTGRLRKSRVVTLLFTDVVGSTALKQRLGDHAGVELVEQHHRLVRQVLADFPGAEEIATAGDSFLILFPVPSEAVKYALLLQRRLREFNRGHSFPVQDRVGLHMGEVLLQETPAGGQNVHGIQVDTCSRVMSLAQAGQILMTRPVFDNARQSLKGDELEETGEVAYLNHGRFELKGVEEPVEICEVRSADSGPLSAPCPSEKARYVTDQDESVLGWRPAVGQIVPQTKWVLEENLGQGGFGEVWKAQHQTLNETRVFKFCFEAERVRLLKREVSLFRVLKERIGEHPNIVKLYDINFDQPPLYLVEEYVTGKDLRNWCEARGGIANVPLETRLEIVAQSAEALQAAHDAGIIHRDIKPGNILIGTRLAPGNWTPGDGQPPRLAIGPEPLAKLSDFGIGQFISDGTLRTNPEFSRPILEPEMPLRTGSQLYMGPELLAGKPASTRSDIYSLGVVLYQVLVGDFAQPVPTDWAEDIPDPLLREDLHHCLAGKPEDRFAAAGLLARSLRALPERRTDLLRKAAEKKALERAAYRRGMFRTAAIAIGLFAVIAALALQARLNGVAKIRQGNQIRSTTVRLVVANGLNPANRGDWLAAGLWFSEAFVLDEAFQQPDEAQLNRQTHRLRINSLLHRSPHLDRMWFEEAHGCGGFDSKGESLLLGDNDGFRFYSIKSGRPESPLYGRGDNVARVSPDGKKVVTGNRSASSSLSIWEAASGARLLDLKAPDSDQPFRGTCSDLQFSNDGRWISAVIPEYEGQVIIWDAATGRLEHLLNYAEALNVGWTNGNYVLATRFDASGERIVTTGTDRRAVVWEWRTGHVLNVLQGHRSWVYTACFGQRHPDWLLTCSFDRTACLWDLRTGHAILKVEHEGDAIQDVRFSPDDSAFVTAGLDSTLRFWDPNTGHLVPPLLRNHDRVMQVEWSPDGSRLVAITWDGTVRVWTFAPDRAEVKLTSTDWTPDGRFALSHQGSAMTRRNLDPSGKTATCELIATNVSAWCFAGGPDRFLLFTRGNHPRLDTAADSDQLPATQLQLRTIRGGAPLGSPLPYDETWSHMVCANGGRRFAFFSGDEEPVGTSKTNSLLLWEPETGSSRAIGFPGEGIESAAFDQKGSRLIIGSCVITNGTGVLRALDLDGTAAPALLLTSRQRVAHVTLSPDGKWLATAWFDKTLDPGDALVWRVPEPGMVFGKPARLHHLDGVLHAAFSDSSQAIATASEDQTAIVWHENNGTWEPSLRPLRCSGQVFACAFSHNGRWLATATRTLEAQILGKWSSEVRIWDIVNSEPVSLPISCPQLLTKLGFVAQDKMLLIESWMPPAEPTRSLINLHVNEGSADELLLRAQLLSAQRSFLSGPLDHLPNTSGDRLSAEQALTYATSVALRPLTKQDCKELWLYLGESASPPQEANNSGR